MKYAIITPLVSSLAIFSGSCASLHGRVVEQRG
jgi:hypothetical protein